MNSLASLLEQHAKNHPELELQDAIKFLYQSCMGSGHLGLEPQAVLERLEAEWAGVEGDADAPPTEPLGNGLCRLSLCACKGQGLEPATLAAIDRHRRTHPQTLVALDGPCATGKTTLGGVLSQLYQCPLFHMDDFFLPPERKTAQRLAEPGGNVDAERFFAEVLSPLSKGEPVRYRPYRCQSGTLGEEILVPPAPLAVVEGVYSLRPDLQPYYHITCFLDVPWSTRRARLLERGGADVLDRFEKLWIPLEDAYFRAFPIREHCDVVLSFS